MRNVGPGHYAGYQWRTHLPGREERYAGDRGLQCPGGRQRDPKPGQYVFLRQLRIPLGGRLLPRRHHPGLRPGGKEGGRVRHGPVLRTVRPAAALLLPAGQRDQRAAAPRVYRPGGEGGPGGRGADGDGLRRVRGVGRRLRAAVRGDHRHAGP